MTMPRNDAFLPMTPAEVEARGWDEVDILFVTGDAYVDHPSFAMAILGRALEAAGFRVAILSQPDWKTAEPWRAFGRPRLFFAVSAGNMDSMINHYTANKKVRNDDAYSPGGRAGLRPDRATLAYCQRSREAFPGVPVIAGGVEASLRRLAHYDYWSDTVRRSVLLDAKADLIIYGMGEFPLVHAARRIDAGEPVARLHDMRGVVYALGGKDVVPAGFEGREPVLLPSYEEVKADRRAFSEATRLIHEESNPYSGRMLVQYHGDRPVVVNPPSLPLSSEEMDEVYERPFTRRPHPSYHEPIPAFQMIKDSVTIMRGCFGGCSFCSLSAHQGRIIQNRTEESILKEITTMAAASGFKGTVSDIGGPSANMYRMRCNSPQEEKKCRRRSCLFPSICRNLNTNHGPLISLMNKSRTIPGVKRVYVASGIRMDLAQKAPSYIKELVHHHVGGHLKVAPEHISPETLRRMYKPPVKIFQSFKETFDKENKAAGKKQYLVPYFMAGHPGTTLDEMIDLALFMKEKGYRPQQVQDFIPAPFDIATSMYYTGLDPFTGKEVPVEKGGRQRHLQRALMQYWKPENRHLVLEALKCSGREDVASLLFKDSKNKITSHSSKQSPSISRRKNKSDKTPRRR